MAECGKQQRSFKDTFSKASGDADESFCDPCKSEGKWIAVEGYCKICDEYLCETCLGVHRKQNITRAHAILERKQIPRRQGSVCNQTLCVEVCKTQHPELLRFYCKDHDEPGCGDCMTLKHTSCKKDRVQDISAGFLKTKEFKDIDQKLKQLHQELEEMADVLDNNLKNLDTTYYNILRKITSVREQINEYLDQILNNIKDAAAQMKKEDEKELKTIQAENQAMKAEIEVMLKTIHDSNVNVSLIFAIAKQAKQRMITMEKEINKSKQLRQQQYEFQISNEIEQIVSAKPPLGTLSRKSPQNVTTMTEKHEQMTSRTSPRKMTVKRIRMTPRTHTIDTKATYNRSINVKGETDKYNCWITDCTLLSPDSLVVIDFVNKNVKLINISNNKVVSSYNTSSEPHRVTALNTIMIAVTLPTERKIQLLNVITTITLEREMKVDTDCCGIAYKDGKFAVIYMYPCRVEILDIKGKLLYTTLLNQRSECRLHQPFYIIFGQDNDTVIVSDCRNHTVSAITFREYRVRTYTRDTLKDPRGMVITSDGVLFVCSSEIECIRVVSPDFKTSKTIINVNDNVVHPMSITHCDINNRLYISNISAFGFDHNNQIQVYDLQVRV